MSTPDDSQTEQAEQPSEGSGTAKKPQRSQQKKREDKETSRKKANKQDKERDELEDEEESSDDQDDEEDEDDEDSEQSDLVSQWATKTKPFLPLVVVVAAAILGFIRGPGAAVLGLAAGAILIAISAFWRSLRILSGEELVEEETSTLATPAAAVEQKRAVLRALKDLEYERGLGKVSDEDYQLLSARYRAEAKKLLKDIDDRLGPARRQAEELIAKELASRTSPPPNETP